MMTGKYRIQWVLLAVLLRIALVALVVLGVYVAVTSDGPPELLYDR